MRIPAAFAAAVERALKDHGPAPHDKLLVCGSLDSGWGFKLNTMKVEIENVQHGSVMVYRNGFPVGIIDAGGGSIIAMGSEVGGAEQAFIEWCESEAVPA